MTNSAPRKSSSEFEHPVQFYADTSALLAELSQYVLAGLEQNETVLLVARAPHAAALEEMLAPHCDLADAKSRGLYVVMDAHETLSAFMVAGMPDQVRFFDVMSSLFVQLSDRSRPIRAFGEMVDILWEQENHAAALKLEELWTQFAKSHQFALFCAYHMENLAGRGYNLPYSQIIESHTRVILH